MGMKIAAVLPWYDEPTAHLDRCVRSLAGVVDILIAVDGRWEHFADDRPILSHWTQAHAIARAADAVALDHYVLMGPSVWASQVAKRNACMALGSEEAEWVFVLDADEYIAHTRGDMNYTRLQLRETELDVATVGCHDLTRSRPFSAIRRVFRRGTTVVTAHNGYNRAGKWLHGDVAHVQLEPALDLSDELCIHDDWGSRDEERLTLKRDYRQARQRHRLEAWR